LWHHQNELIITISEATIWFTKSLLKSFSFRRWQYCIVA
jgi:hypothetical protein